MPETSRTSRIFATAFTLSLAGAVIAQDATAVDRPARDQDTPQLGVQQAAGRAKVVDEQNRAENIATIVEIRGRVQGRRSDDADWSALKVGSVYPKGASFRTGGDSLVRIRIGAGQLITVESRGRFSLEKLINEQGVDKSLIDLEYGRLQFNVTKEEFDNELTVTSSEAVLAVLGTDGVVEVMGRETRSFGLPENTGVYTFTYQDNVKTKATIREDHETDDRHKNPADHAYYQTLVHARGSGFDHANGMILGPDTDDERELIERTTGKTLVELNKIEGAPRLRDEELLRRLAVFIDDDTPIVDPNPSPPPPPPPGPPAPPPPGPPAPPPPPPGPPAPPPPGPPAPPPPPPPPPPEPVPYDMDVLFSAISDPRLFAGELYEREPVPFGFESYFADLPELGTSDVGGLATRLLENGDLQIILLEGGRRASDPNLSRGFNSDTLPTAANEFYVLTLRQFDDGSVEVVDDGWQFLGSLGSFEEDDPLLGVNPFQGLAAFDGNLYTLQPEGFGFDSRGDTNSGSKRFLFPGSPSTLLGVDLDEGFAFPIGTFYSSGRFTALDGANDQNGIVVVGEPFAEFYPFAESGGAQGNFAGNPIIFLDPRTGYISRATLGLAPSDSTIYGAGLDASVIFSTAMRVTGAAWHDGLLHLSVSYDRFPGGFRGQGGRPLPSALELTFIVDPFDLDPQGRASVLAVLDAYDGDVNVLGLAGIGYDAPGGPTFLANPSGGLEQFAGIDPLFAQLSFSQEAVEGETALTQMVRYAFLTSAIDPDSASFSNAYADIPQTLLNSVDLANGIGRAVGELRAPLPNAHAANSFSNGDLVIGSAGVFDFFGKSTEIQLGSRRYVVNDENLNLGLPTRSIGFFNDPVGGYTVSNTDALPDIVVVPRVGVDGFTGFPDAPYERFARALVGGEWEFVSGGFSVFAVNEIHQLDLTGGAGWQFVGSVFQDPGFDIGIDPQLTDEGTPLLTGLAAFEGQDYASALDGRLFRLQYPGDASNRGESIGLDRSWYLGLDLTEAVASAESLGSLFVTGQYAYEAPAFGRGDSSHFDNLSADNPLADLTIIAFDPRSGAISNTWWGAAGDFITSPVTTGNNDLVALQGLTDQRVRVEGSAYFGGALVLDVHSNTDRGELPNDFFLSINPAAQPSENGFGVNGDPVLYRVDVGEAGVLNLGLSSGADDTGASAAAPIVLQARDEELPFDDFTINASFANLGYTDAALRSGVLQDIFATEFARPTVQPDFCRVAILGTGRVRNALAQFEGVEGGVGLATAQLRQQIVTDGIDDCAIVPAN